MTDLAAATPMARRTRRPLAARLSERKRALIFAAPAILTLIALYVGPLAHLIPTSFEDAQNFSLAAYQRIFGSSFGLMLLGNALRLGLITTLVTLALGYPAAFGLAMSRGPLRTLYLASLFLPLAVSVIVKAFAWTILLRSHGVLNEILLTLGVTHAPIRMIFTQGALIAGAANIFLPFMVLPIYAVVAQIDPRLTEAAATLGASPLSAFLRVTVALTAPGVVAGVALVFSLSSSAYVVPTLLMGEAYPTLATTIAKSFLISREPALGSAAGVVLMALGLAVVIVSQRFAHARTR